MRCDKRYRSKCGKVDNSWKINQWRIQVNLRAEVRWYGSASLSETYCCSLMRSSCYKFTIIWMRC